MSLIAFISDTHTFHSSIKTPADVDILVHCGDNTIYGEIAEMKNFIEWFGNQKPRHKIFINGNHEVKVSKLGDLTKRLVEEHNKYHFTNIHYLEEEEVVIEGIKFWGSPYTPEFFDWAYMYNREDGERRWMGIPDDADVLITHGPPYGIMDNVQPFDRYQFDHAGCSALLEKIKEVKPKIHAFGHIHGSYGTERIADTLFINASTCNEAYIPIHPVIVVDSETWEIV